MSAKEKPLHELSDKELAEKAPGILSWEFWHFVVENAPRILAAWCSAARYSGSAHNDNVIASRYPVVFERFAADIMVMPARYEVYHIATHINSEQHHLALLIRSGEQQSIGSATWIHFDFRLVPRTDQDDNENADEQISPRERLIRERFPNAMFPPNFNFNDNNQMMIYVSTRRLAENDSRKRENFWKLLQSSVINTNTVWLSASSLAAVFSCREIQCDLKSCVHAVDILMKTFGEGPTENHAFNLLSVEISLSCRNVPAVRVNRSKHFRTSSVSAHHTHRSAVPEAWSSLARQLVDSRQRISLSGVRGPNGAFEEEFGWRYCVEKGLEWNSDEIQNWSTILYCMKNQPKIFVSGTIFGVPSRRFEINRALAQKKVDIYNQSNAVVVSSQALTTVVMSPTSKLFKLLLSSYPKGLRQVALFLRKCVVVSGSVGLSKVIPYFQRLRIRLKYDFSHDDECLAVCRAFFKWILSHRKSFPRRENVDTDADFEAALISDDTLKKRNSFRCSVNEAKINFKYYCESLHWNDSHLELPDTVSVCDIFDTAEFSASFGCPLTNIEEVKSWYELRVNQWGDPGLDGALSRHPNPRKQCVFIELRAKVSLIKKVQPWTLFS